MVRALISFVGCREGVDLDVVGVASDALDTVMVHVRLAVCANFCAAR
jgi:hypothetical protein